MTTFIKTKFKKSDDQTNIDKYRVAANIIEYQINLHQDHCFKLDVGLIGHNYKVATLLHST